MKTTLCICATARQSSTNMSVSGVDHHSFFYFAVKLSTAGYGVRAWSKWKSLSFLVLVSLCMLFPLFRFLDADQIEIRLKSFMGSNCFLCIYRQYGRE